MRAAKTLLSSVVAGFLTLSLSGCYQDKVMDLKLEGGQFFERGGYPSDLLLQKGKLSMAGFPKVGMEINPTLLQYRAIAERDFSGFAPDQTLYMKFQGDIQPEDIHLPSDIDAYVSSSAAVQLIDIDPDSASFGKRYPLITEYRFDKDEYRPDDLLQVRPAVDYLQQDTTYALVVTRAVAAKNGDKLEVNSTLADLLSGKRPKGVSRQRADEALKVYQPLREFLQQDSLSRQQIIGASVWTTGKVTAKAQQIATAVQDLAQPVLNGELQRVEENDNYCILSGSWQVPQWQRGLFPFATPLDNGRLELNNGALKQYSERTSPITITIPKQATADQLPLMFYHHGTDGRSTQSFTRGVTLASGEKTREGAPAEVAASQGWATASMGGYMGADHQDSLPLLDFIGDQIPGLSLNIASYNFINIQAMRDNLLQMMGERILFRRLVNNLTIEAGSCDNANPIRFDQATQVAMGQSLGSFTAGAQVAFDPQPLQGYIGTGAGAYDLRLVMNLAAISATNTPLGETLEPLFFWTSKQSVINDPFHPVWAITDQILAPADFSYGLNSRQRLGNPTHQLLVLGHFDDWVGLPSQRKLLRAIQPDMVGDDIDVEQKDKLITDVRAYGGEQYSAVAANSRSGVTNAVVRYAEDGVISGHNVYFQQTNAHDQLACFLSDIANQRAPLVEQTPREGCSY